VLLINFDPLKLELRYFDSTSCYRVFVDGQLSKQGMLPRDARIP